MAPIQSEPNWCDIESLKPSYHEAGHAVIARLTGFEVAWVSVDEKFIQQDPLAIQNICASGMPVCMTLSSFRLNSILKKRSALNKNDKETVIGYCMHVLAGPFAEERLHPQSFDAELSMNDYAQVSHVLNGLKGNKAAKKAIFDTARRRLNKALDEHWHAINNVGEALRRCKTLTGCQVDTILYSNSIRSAA